MYKRTANPLMHIICFLLISNLVWIGSTKTVLSQDEVEPREILGGLGVGLEDLLEGLDFSGPEWTAERQKREKERVIAMMLQKLNEDKLPFDYIDDLEQQVGTPGYHAWHNLVNATMGMDEAERVECLAKFRRYLAERDWWKLNSMSVGEEDPQDFCLIRTEVKLLSKGQDEITVEEKWAVCRKNTARLIEQNNWRPSGEESEDYQEFQLQWAYPYPAEGEDFRPLIKREDENKRAYYRITAEKTVIEWQEKEWTEKAQEIVSELRKEDRPFDPYDRGFLGNSELSERGVELQWLDEGAQLEFALSILEQGMSERDKELIEKKWLKDRTTYLKRVGVEILKVEPNGVWVIETYNISSSSRNNLSDDIILESEVYYPFSGNKDEIERRRGRVVDEQPGIETTRSEENEQAGDISTSSALTDDYAHLLSSPNAYGAGDEDPKTIDDLPVSDEWKKKLKAVVAEYKKDLGDGIYYTLGLNSINGYTVVFLNIKKADGKTVVSKTYYIDANRPRTLQQRNVSSVSSRGTRTAGFMENMRSRVGTRAPSARGATMRSASRQSLRGASTSGRKAALSSVSDIDVPAVFPNPAVADDVITITGIGQQIAIYTQLGKLVSRRALVNGTLSMPVSELPGPGLYWAKSNGQVVAFQVVR